jgi:hypothetical protein
MWSPWDLPIAFWGDISRTDKVFSNVLGRIARVESKHFTEHRYIDQMYFRQQPILVAGINDKKALRTSPFGGMYGLVGEHEEYTIVSVASPIDGNYKIYTTSSSQKKDSPVQLIGDTLKTIPGYDLMSFILISKDLHKDKPVLSKLQGLMAWYFADGSILHSKHTYKKAAPLQEKI